MHRMLLAAAVAALFVSAPLRAQSASTAPAAAKPPDRAGGVQAGTYDLELAFGGGTMAGTLVITTVGDSTNAKLLVGDHAPPIKSVTRNGSHLTLSGSGDGADVRYDLQFSGDALVGKFTFNGDIGAVTGKRRK